MFDVPVPHPDAHCLPNDHDVDSGDSAAAWSITYVAPRRYLWRAWSDWTRAQAAGPPEVTGICGDAAAAMQAARNAAGSMHPSGRSVRISASPSVSRPLPRTA